MLSWRRYLRVIVVPSEGWAELGGRAKLQCAACSDKLPAPTADDETVLRGARESPNSVPT